MSKQLKVSEAFYSVQGEGKTVGKPAYFLRLADCNLLCGGKGTIKDKKLHDGATWRCDSIEVWTVGERQENTEIVKSFGEGFIKKLKSREAHLVVTGGEPLLQMPALISFLGLIMIATDFRAFIEVETNGTIKPDQQLEGFVSLWNVSPKLKNSGMEWKYRMNTAAITTLDRMQSIFKFVVSNESDIQEVEWEWDGVIKGKQNIYLMPGVDKQEDYAEISQKVIEWCKAKGYLYGARLQIAIYNQKTGV